MHTLARTIFHGPEPVRAIEVLLYIDIVHSISGSSVERFQLLQSILRLSRKQCGCRSAGFLVGKPCGCRSAGFTRSQLICFQTVFHGGYIQVNEDKD